jgi:hypothetical protein
MTGRLLRRLGVVAGLALVLVGAAAGPAAAHAVGTGTEASNYRTTVYGIDQGTPGISVRALTGGLLELTNRSGQEVLVLGYRLEPYLRVGPDGVFENRRSPSTYTNRFRTAPASIPAEFDPQAAPEWRRIGDGPSAGWHDHRAHWTGPDPPAVKAKPGAVQAVRTWEVPLRQGDRTMVVRGDITWVPGPAPWPWLLAAVGLFAAALAGAGGYQRPRVLAVVALAAVAADMVHTAGALLASTAPLATQLYERAGRLPPAARAGRHRPDLPAPGRRVPDPGRGPARPVGPGPLPAPLGLRSGRHPGRHHLHPRPGRGHGRGRTGRLPGPAPVPTRRGKLRAWCGGVGSGAGRWPPASSRWPA